MKKGLFISLLTSALLAGITQNSDGTFIDIYTDKDSQSNISATVSTSKGNLVKKRCFSNRDSERWCKVKYVYKDLTLHGFVDEGSLEMVSSIPNTNATYELSFGGRHDDVGNDIIVVDDGYLMVGNTSSFGQGQNDAYVVKVDKFGNKIYSLAIGGSSEDTANAVVELNDGYFLTGSTRSFGNGVESIFMSKFSKDGNVLWKKGYYSDKDDYYRGNDVIKISDTNMLVAGYENHVKFFNSEVNIYLNAIDSKGQRNGIKRYGGNKIDEANSIISTNDGYVIAGVTKSWGHGAEDAYVIKIDKDGNKIWHNAFGFDYDEVANQIIATRDGGYILVGTTDSDIKNQQDIYVVKLRADGTLDWQGHYGSREDEEGFGIVESNDGYVIAGYTKETPSYNSDAYILKLDRDGHVMWQRKYGLDKDDEARAIVAVEDGYVLTGYRTSEESYSKDLYILKVDKNGNIN